MEDGVKIDMNQNGTLKYHDYELSPSEHGHSSIQYGIYVCIICIYL